MTPPAALLRRRTANSTGTRSKTATLIQARAGRRLPADPSRLLATLVPTLHVRPKPQLRSPAPEIHHRPGHVRVPALIQAHRVSMAEPDELGHFLRVYKIAYVNPPRHIAHPFVGTLMNQFASASADGFRAPLRSCTPYRRLRTGAGLGAHPAAAVPRALTRRRQRAKPGARPSTPAPRA